MDTDSTYQREVFDPTKMQSTTPEYVGAAVANSGSMTAYKLAQESAQENAVDARTSTDHIMKSTAAMDIEVASVSPSSSEGKGDAKTSGIREMPDSPSSNESEVEDEEPHVYPGGATLKERSLTFNVRRLVDTLRAVERKEIEAAKSHKKKRTKKNKVFNFAVGTGTNTKLYKYEDVSLCFLTRRNRFRQYCVRLSSHSGFKNFILLTICVNAILLAMGDYSKVDSDGNLVSAGSWRNALNAHMNSAFVVVFALEMIIKIIAQGLVGSHGSYLSSMWNLLDVIVVVSGILAISSDNMENVSALRMIRVMRPLRSLKLLPAMKTIISSIFKSIPQLGGVFSLMGFIFFLFAVAGLEIFGTTPSSHARCRVTPYPVTLAYISPVLDPSSAHNYADFRCIAGPTVNFEDEEGSLGIVQKTSPWVTPQPCYWPVAPEETARLCSLDNSGFNNCLHDTDVIPELEWTWCGSNWDGFGNKRFSPAGYEIYGNGHYPKNDIDIYLPELNFGYSNFDNFGVAVLVIFQVITKEGWTNILYLMMDAYGPARSVPYFCLLVIFGVYFVLQLLLAVLEDNFSAATKDYEEDLVKQQHEREEKLLQMRGDTRSKVLVVGVVENSKVQQKILRSHLQLLSQYLPEKKLVFNLFDTPSDFLSCVGKNKPARVVQEFDVLITGQLFLKRSRQSEDKHRGMRGHELIAYLKKLPVGPMHRLKRIVGCTPDSMDYKALMKTAGADAVISPKPLDFHKPVAGPPSDDDDIVHTIVKLLGLAPDMINENEKISSAALSPHAPSEKGFSPISPVRDARNSNQEVELVGRSQTPASYTSLDDDSEDSDEDNIFTTRAASHVFEQDFRKITRQGADFVCSNPIHKHKSTGSRARMKIVVKPLKYALRRKCVACENIINYHYLQCDVCHMTMCMQCAALEWDTSCLPASGERVQTPYGDCLVTGVALNTAAEVDFESTIINAVHSKWKLAGGSAVRLHLSMKDVTVTEYGVGDVISCQYGGLGFIRGVRNNRYAGIHYMVEPLKWQLADATSPVLVLNRSAIKTLVKSAVRERIYATEQLLRQLDKEAFLVHEDHDKDIEAPVSAGHAVPFGESSFGGRFFRTSPNFDSPGNKPTAAGSPSPTGVSGGGGRKKPAMRMSVSNVSSVSSGSADFAAWQEAPELSNSHSAIDVKFDSGNQGMLNFFKKRFLFVSAVAIRKSVSQNIDLSDTALQPDEDPSRSNADTMASRDPRTFVHLPRFALSDLVGSFIAKNIFACASAFRRCYTFLLNKCRASGANEGKKDAVVSKAIIVTDAESTGFRYYMHAFSSRCLSVVDWRYYDAASGGVILLNTVVLMSDHYPMKSSVASALDISNAVLTIVFTIEMIINLSARGYLYYFRDFMTGFDALVVIASIIDLALSPPVAWGSSGLNLESGGVSSIVSLLRCFRLFRMVKLGLKIRSLKILLYRIVKTFYHLGAFVVLLGVLLFCFTIGGMQFFANRFRFNAAGEAITDIGSQEWIHAPEISRSTYDNFTLAFATVFQLLTTENWNDIMFNSWRVYGPFGVLFPVIFVMLGAFVLMNLFLGIVLGNFTSDDEEAADAELEKVAELEKKTKLVVLKLENTAIGNIWGAKAKSRISLKNHARTQPPGKEKDKVGQDEDVEMVRIKGSPFSVKRSKSTETLDSPSGSGVLDEGANASEIAYSMIGDTTDTESDAVGGSIKLSELELELASPAAETQTCCFGLFGQEALPANPLVIRVTVPKKASVLAYKGVEEHFADDIFPLPPVYSLGIFAPDNCFRVLCGRILSTSAFEAAVQLMIFLTSVSIILDNPLHDPKSSLSKGLRIFELVTTAMFILEACIKIIALGFAFNTRAYLRNSWNILDFIIVATSIASEFTGSNSPINSLKAIRSFRALRPLRVISRAPGLRVIVTALFESLPDVLNVVGVIIVVFTIFAVLGVNFLKGQMRHCAGPVFNKNIAPNVDAMALLTHPVSYADMTPTQQGWFAPSSTIADFTGCTQAPCCNLDVFSSASSSSPTSKMLCECWGGSWKPSSHQTFDNYPYAMAAFVVISTTEGWVDLMYAAVDSAGIDMQPVLNYNYAYIYFFIFFIIIGAFFAMNLFVGVMLDNFSRVKLEQVKGASLFMTAEQQEWIKTYQIVKLIKPHARSIPPETWIGKKAYAICNHWLFERIILGCIVLNSIVLGINYFGIKSQLSSAFDTTNIAFAGIFSIEMILKLCAFRWAYWSSKWNLFDGLVTIGTDLGVLVFYTSRVPIGIAISIIRVFRVLRIVRLFEGLVTARRLVDTLLFTLPGIINISILLILLLCIYAALGMQLFATVGFNQSYNVYANFRSFGISMLTLFRFTTGESWGSFMVDVAEKLPQCLENPVYSPNLCGYSDSPVCEPLNGCGNMAIYAYLISFTIFVAMVVFNLFVGVILEGFSAANSAATLLQGADFKVFVKHWALFDPHGGLFITVSQFEEFIATLPAPMGLGDQHPSHQATVEFLSNLELKIYVHEKYAESVIHFKDCLTALSTRAIETVKGVRLDEFQTQIDFAQDSTYKATLRSGSVTIKTFSSAGHDAVAYTLREHYAAIFVQSALRRRKRAEALARGLKASGMHSLPSHALVSSIQSLTDGSRVGGLHHQEQNSGVQSSASSSAFVPYGQNNPVRAAGNAAGAGGSNVGDAYAVLENDEGDDESEGSDVSEDDDSFAVDADQLFALLKVEESEAQRRKSHFESNPTEESAVPSGVKTFSNGDVYKGEMTPGGVMHGWGLYVYTDGAEYSGSMHRGQRHGLGKYTSSSGEMFIGYQKHNQRHGEGVKYCKDGEIQNGEWEKGIFQGPAVSPFKTSKSK